MPATLVTPTQAELLQMGQIEFLRRQKISRAKAGRTPSETHRQRLREAALKFHAERRKREALALGTNE